MKKKILFVISNFLNGGAEKNLIRIINNLDDEHYIIAVLCLKRVGRNAEFLKKDVEIIDINSPSVYFSIFKIRKVINQVKPDIVFSWMGYINAYLAFFIPFFNKNIKWLCRESGIPSKMNKQQKFPWLFNYLYRKYNRYNMIVCQSDYMTKDLSTNFGVSNKKILKINNPIDFTEVDIKKKSSYKVKSSEFRLLYVGGLRIEKRVELLVEVLAILPENYHLTIIGSGNQYNIILRSINFHKLNNRTQIIQDCYNPFPYYVQSDCLLLSSLFEGFPNVVIEAFACGCPAIGYNIIGGADEVLQNYGGISLQNKNLNELADQIKLVCESEIFDRERIISDCKEKYDISKIIPYYNSLLLC